MKRVVHHSTAAKAGRPLGSRKQEHPPVLEARAIVRECRELALRAMPTHLDALDDFVGAYRAGSVGGDLQILEPAVRAIDAILARGQADLPERGNARRDAAVCFAFDRIRELRVDPQTARLQLSEAECAKVVAKASVDGRLWPGGPVGIACKIDKRRSSA